MAQISFDVRTNPQRIGDLLFAGGIENQRKRTNGALIVVDSVIVAAVKVAASVRQRLLHVGVAVA